MALPSPTMTFMRRFAAASGIFLWAMSSPSLAQIPPCNDSRTDEFLRQSLANYFNKSVFLKPLTSPAEYNVLIRSYDPQRMEDALSKTLTVALANTKLETKNHKMTAVMNSFIACSVRAKITMTNPASDKYPQSAKDVSLVGTINYDIRVNLDVAEWRFAKPDLNQWYPAFAWELE